MARTIITISNPRPIKVLAFLLCLISVFLLIVAASSSSWVYSGGWREGLFDRCVSAGTPTPLPFGMKAVSGCIPGRRTKYIYITATLVIVAMFADLIGTLLTGLGLKSSHPIRKYMCYRFAIFILLFALIAIATAVAVYPIYFNRDLAAGGNNPPLDGFNVIRADVPHDIEDDIPAKWNAIIVKRSNEDDTDVNGIFHAERLILDIDHTKAEIAIGPEFKARDPKEFSYGFCYGFSWICLIFIFISVGCLIYDYGSEEIFYKEVPNEVEKEAGVEEKL